jgi:SP family galactose:H+ symporter-like MFS transporter
LLSRLISGLGVGIVSLVIPLYLAEISPSKLRGTFVATYQLAITLGIVVSFAINYIYSLNADWRWMFAMGVFPAIFQFIALFFVPETPAWLFKQGQSDRAVATLARLRQDQEWRSQLEAMKSAASPTQKEGKWKDLLAPSYRFVLLIGLFLSTFQQITGINTVIYYAPKIFQTAGFASATGAILATLSIGMINVFATGVASWLLDKVGRRLLLLLGTAGMALSLGFLAFAFFIASPLIGKISVICLMCYVAAFAIGLGPATWVVISEIYPMEIRGKAMTVATFANWFFNYLVSLTFLSLIKSLGAQGTFCIYALLSAVTFWLVFSYLPETKGKTLEEIENLLVPSKKSASS